MVRLQQSAILRYPCLNLRVKQKVLRYCKFIRHLRKSFHLELFSPSCGRPFHIGAVFTRMRPGSIVTRRPSLWAL